MLQGGKALGQRRCGSSPLACTTKGIVMNRAIQKLRAGLAYKYTALERMRTLIARQEADIAEAEKLDAQIRAAGGTEEDAIKAIMARWKLRFSDRQSCQKFNLPLDPKLAYGYERTIMQALLDGPLSMEDLMRETKLAGKRLRLTATLKNLREAGIVAIELSADNTPKWRLLK